MKTLKKILKYRAYPFEIWNKNIRFHSPTDRSRFHRGPGQEPLGIIPRFNQGRDGSDEVARSEQWRTDRVARWGSNVPILVLILNVVGVAVPKGTVVETATTTTTTTS